MTKYLLDTHVLLWSAENSPLLSAAAKGAVTDKDSEKYVSLVSAWEVTIKLGTGKLRFTGGLPGFLRMIEEKGFYILTLEQEYFLQIPSLPDYHKDPFDRMLIATAIAENMTLVTADENIHKYNVSWVW